MDIGISLFLHEIRMLRKRVGIRMLKNEIASVVQNVLCKNAVRQGVKSLKGIWRIRKNQISLHPAYLEKVKDIVPDHIDILQ